MKRFIEGADRCQVMLLPDCLDDYVDEESPVISATTPMTNNSVQPMSNICFQSRLVRPCLYLLQA